jgi:hypothetical protein
MMTFFTGYWLTRGRPHCLASRNACGRAGGLALDRSLEDEDMTGPTMIREVDVKAHPNELPILIFEFAQMLMKHSRVKPRIHACQVPNVDCVLDRPHQTRASASSSFIAEG